jgi:hypothetical protein
LRAASPAPLEDACSNLEMHTSPATAGPITSPGVVSNLEMEREHGSRHLGLQ